MKNIAIYLPAWLYLPKALLAYIIDARYSLLTIILAGFGRAISEVGAVMIVGGNIDHCQVMTTAIALETSKGIGTCPCTWHHSASAGIAGKFCRTAI